MRIVLLAALPAAACAAQLEVLTLLNWQRLPVGESAIMEGGAVVARIGGPAAGFNNPAGLADLERPSVSGTVNAIEYTRVGARTPNGNANADDIQQKPNLVGFANTLDSGGGWAFTLANPITWTSAIEVRASTAGGTRSDNGRSSLEAASVGLSYGKRVHDRISLGAAIESWLCDYRYDAGSTAQDGSTVLTGTYTESGRQIDLRLSCGAQVDLGSWRFGAMLRSPGLRLFDQGSISSSATTGDGTTVVLTHVRDETLGFDLPLPWTCVLGAAWQPESVPGLAAEFDLSISGGSGNTTVLRPASGSITTITGGSSSVVQYALDARELDLQVVINPRLGMSYRFPQPFLERAVSAHLGAYIDKSPVERSNVFSELDLLGGTAGISLEKGPMVVALGGAYITSGSLSDAIGYVASPGSGLRPDLENTDATFAVRTFVLTIASTYRF